MEKVDLGSELSFGEFVVKSGDKKVWQFGRLAFLENAALSAWVSGPCLGPTAHQVPHVLKKLAFLKKSCKGKRGTQNHMYYVGLSQKIRNLMELGVGVS